LFVSAAASQFRFCRTVSSRTARFPAFRFLAPNAPALPRAHEPVDVRVREVIHDEPVAEMREQERPRAGGRGPAARARGAGVGAAGRAPRAGGASVSRCDRRAEAPLTADRAPSPVPRPIAGPDALMSSGPASRRAGPRGRSGHRGSHGRTVSLGHSERRTETRAYRASRSSTTIRSRATARRPRAAHDRRAQSSPVDNLSAGGQILVSPRSAGTLQVNFRR
jgi:hypothetical protein